LLSYSIIDLGTLGGNASKAYGINETRHVVGVAGDGTSNHAFFYNGSSLTDVGVLDGTESSASAINNGGIIVGESSYTGGATTDRHAFLKANGNLIDLGTLGGTSSHATGVNDAGQVVGYSHYAGGGINYHAFLYHEGVMTDIGTLGGTSSRAHDINNSGQIVGLASDGAAEHAFTYNGTMIDIGVLPGFAVGSEATGVNNLGHVVGGSYAEFGIHKQKIYHGFLYKDGVLTDLGNLGQGGNWSFAHDINDKGQIVGSANTTFGNSPFHAFVWQNGTMTDLNHRLPANSGWTLTAAYAINNRGYIVGYGTNPAGEVHGFMLRPRPAWMLGQSRIPNISRPAQAEANQASGPEASSPAALQSSDPAPTSDANTQTVTTLTPSRGRNVTQDSLDALQGLNLDPPR
jgi:probable HAF family extracellular repeat protein